MRKKLHEFRQQIIIAIKRNPVEIFLSILFCCIGCYQVNEEEAITFMLLLYSPVLYLITYTLNSLCERGLIRFLYYASPLLAIPFLWIKPIDNFPTTFIVSVIVIQLIYLASCRLTDNELFMKKTLLYFIAVFSAVILAGVFGLLSVSIIASVQYIFEIGADDYESNILYVAAVSVFGIMPLLFLMFNRKRELEITDNKIFDILLNYLLSPALLIYAAILYIYLFKIVVLWSLPKGGVAYIVVIFSALLFLLKGCRLFLKKHGYDWFYNNASLITLPALAMYWVGSLYRINEYGFTEARVYLVAVGLALTGIALIFLSKRTGKYLYAVWLTIFMLSAVTYIPGLTAKNIEHRSQATRIDNGSENIVAEIVVTSHHAPIDVEAFKSLELVYDTQSDAIWLDTANDTLRLFDNDTLLFAKSVTAFWGDQLSKVGLQTGDSIPESLYPELLKLELENGRLIFDNIILQQDTVTRLYGLYYLKR